MENGAVFEVESSAGDSAEIAITFPDPAIVRLRMAPGTLGHPQDRLLLGDPGSGTHTTPSADTQGVTLATSALRLRVTRDPWTLSLRDTEDRRITSAASDNRNIHGHFEMPPLGWEKNADGSAARFFESLSLAPDERLYGFGERFVPLDQRGRRFESWTTDPLGVSSHQAYKPVPFGLSSRGYGLFVNSSARIEFDIGATSPLSAGFALEAGELDYFLIHGPRLTEVLRRYWRLTGAPPTPPRWSFGFWSSRFGYKDRKEVEDVARGYRARGIPCDVIHLDPQWMGGPKTWCHLTWDTAAFPDPAGMLAALRAQGFRVCLWENPYVPQGSGLYAEGAARGFFVRDAAGQPWLLPGWAEKNTPTALVDFTHPGAVAWWREQHHRLLKMGVAAFKTDFGEWAPEEGRYHDGTSGAEVHNLYPLLYNKAVFEAMEAHSPGQGLVWSRSATAGSHRYPVHWGGDSRTSFGHMASSLRGGLNLMLSGFAYWSHDIGGFIQESNPALYARWAQFGLFCSHARAHGTTPREPWVFGPEAEAIFRKYAVLRYRLLPYIHSCAARAAATGRPLLRPLLLDYQDDPNTHTLDLQYLFGDAFLVAPVFAELDDVRVYLPQGRWHDYWTRQVHTGPGWITVHAPLDTLPLLVREGAIIPMGPAQQFVDEKPLDPLTLDIYPAGAGACAITAMAAPIETSYQLDKRSLTLDIRGYQGQVEVLLNGMPAPQEVRVNGVRMNRWEAREHALAVKFPATGTLQLRLDFSA